MRHLGRLVVSIFIVIVVALIAAFAVANRAPVTVNFWPLPWTIRPPLYAAVLAAGAAGLIVGAALCAASRFRLWLRARASESRAERLARAAAAAQPQAAAPAAPAPVPTSRAVAPRTRAAMDDG